MPWVSIPIFRALSSALRRNLQTYTVRPMSIDRRRRDNRPMTQTTAQALRTRSNLAERWQVDAGVDRKLFRSCCLVLEAARQLERDVSARSSEGASAGALGCLQDTFESLANTSLMLRDEVDPDHDPLPRPGTSDRQDVQLGQLLFAIDQNLRFAAHAAGLGRETLVGDTTDL